MEQNIKNFFKWTGILLWGIVLPAWYLLWWARGPRGFASFAGWPALVVAFLLVGFYVALFILYFFVRKNLKLRENPWFSNAGYIIGILFLIYTFLL